MLGIVRHIRIHAPNQRRYDTGADGDKHLENHHQPPSKPVIRHKEEEHAEHYQAHERNDISGLLSKLHGQRHSQRHTNHITHFTHHQEQAGIQYQIEHPEIEECIGTDIVLEEVGGSSSAYRIEEIRQQRRTIQYPPRRIAHQ